MQVLERKSQVVSSAHIVNHPPQLPRAGPKWHASTPVGLHRHICGYLPSTLRLIFQEISIKLYLYRLTPGAPRRLKPREVRSVALVSGIHIYIHLV